MPEVPLWFHNISLVAVAVCFLFASYPLSDVWPYLKWRVRISRSRNAKPAGLIWGSALVLVALGVVSEYITTLPTPSPPPAPVVTDDGTFVYDETIPDDTQVLPGQSFVKTWRLYNRGTSDWKNYEARRFGQLSTGTFGPSGIRVDDTLAKHDVSITKEMVAPATPGCYRAVYQLFDGLHLFGEMFYVEIVVVNPQVRDYAVFINDLNARDYTLFNPGESFRKGWRLHNCGKNTWVNYNAKRVGGSLPGPASIPVPVTSGNQSVDIWADFTAPLMQTPESSAVYQLEDASGHPVGNVTFDVIIKTESSA